MSGFRNSVAFIIDTNKYAGNFEREMCAYVTGRVGECGVGSDYVETSITNQFGNVIDISEDEEDCYRPTTCYPLKNSQKHDAVAIFFDLKNPPSKEQIELMKERSIEFGKDHTDWQKNSDPIEVIGFRMVTFETSTKEIEI